MASVVRNTLLHMNERPEEDNSLSCSGQSRPTVVSNENNNVAASTDVSAVNSDDDLLHKVDTSTDSERGEQADSEHCSIEGFDSSEDEPNEVLAGQPTVAVQHELEAMSQAVMDIWSALGALEAKLSHDPPVPSPVAPPAEAASSVRAGETARPKQAVQPGADNARSKRRGKKASRLEPRPQCLKLCAESLEEVGTVLEAAKHAVDSAPGVVGTKVALATGGTIATLHINMLTNSPDSMRASASAIVKAALLEAAAYSESVYVLGYEAMPFEDDTRGGFGGTLAIAPASLQHTACWETYQKGICPRGSACKWQHPGRDGIQPIRVLFC